MPDIIGSIMRQTLTRPAARIFPGAAVFNSLDNLMEVGADGMDIATPSALHAKQAAGALERGMAIPCQRKALEAKVGRAAA